MENRAGGDLLHWWTLKPEHLVAWWDAEAGEYVYRPLSEIGKGMMESPQIIKGDSAEPEREAREGSRKGL